MNLVAVEKGISRTEHDVCLVKRKKLNCLHGAIENARQDDQQGKGAPAT